MPIADRRKPALVRTRGTGITTTRIVVALVIPLVAYFGLAAGQRALEVYRLNQEAARVRGETEILKGEYARLLNRLEYLKSDAYVEKVAREQLNLVKPGDRAVVVLAPEGRREHAGPAQASTEDAGDTPNWWRWWNFFFGVRR